MGWYPLYNSVRIAAASTAIVYFLGIFLANVVARAPRVVKGVLDVVPTLPLVLPPTVVGYLLLHGTWHPRGHHRRAWARPAHAARRSRRLRRRRDETDRLRISVDCQPNKL